VNYRHILCEVSDRIATITLNRPDRMNAWTPIMERDVRHANALDLLMSARRVTSDEALRIGLVNRLYPADQLREQTYAYARDLADFVSPSAIAVIKRQLYEVPFQTLAEATVDANREMADRAARQRFPRRRGEFYGEAAAPAYGE
jgi:enoyl-CoA hydratase/carnithine racemase